MARSGAFHPGGPALHYACLRHDCNEDAIAADRDIPRYLKPYQAATDRHGAGFGATLWNSRASQELRFAVLAETVNLAGKRVLDAGCATGDLLAWLEHHNAAPAHYVGIDALAEMIDRARGRTFATTHEFHVADLVAQPDVLATRPAQVVVISGTLNTLDEVDFLALLARAFAAADECLAFNFLSARHSPIHPRGDGVIRRMDPTRVLDFGFSLTRRIIVRHDYYEGHDCTMAWWK